MIRTIEEVRARYNDPDRKKRDMFGFGSEVLAVHLPEGWQPGHEKEAEKFPLTEEFIRKEASEYLTFAFGKALDHRGLSANRSVIKLREWMWLLGFDDVVEFSRKDSSYTNYGVPILKRCAEALGVNIPGDIAQWPDGEACTPDCDNGCGA